MADGEDIAAALALLGPVRAWGERCYSRLRAVEQWAQAEEK